MVGRVVADPSLDLLSPCVMVPQVPILIRLGPLGNRTSPRDPCHRLGARRVDGNSGGRRLRHQGTTGHPPGLEVARPALAHFSSFSFYTEELARLPYSVPHCHQGPDAGEPSGEPPCEIFGCGIP
jgi:hypothetical protein